MRMRETQVLPMTTMLKAYVSTFPAKKSWVVDGKYMAVNEHVHKSVCTRSCTHLCVYCTVRCSSCTRNLCFHSCTLPAHNHVYTCRHVLMHMFVCTFVCMYTYLVHAVCTHLVYNHVCTSQLALVRQACIVEDSLQQHGGDKKVCQAFCLCACRVHSSQYSSTVHADVGIRFPFRKKITS